MRQSGQTLEIEDVILHPKYERQAYQDIAVVKLKPNKSKSTKMKRPSPGSSLLQLLGLDFWEHTYVESGEFLLFG